MQHACVRLPNAPCNAARPQIKMSATMPKEFPDLPPDYAAPSSGVGLTDAERIELARRRAEAAEKWRAYVESGALLHRIRAEYLEKQFLLARQRDRRASTELSNLNQIVKDWVERYDLLDRRHANLLLNYHALERELDRIASMRWLQGVTYISRQRLKRSRIGSWLRALKHRVSSTGKVATAGAHAHVRGLGEVGEEEKAIEVVPEQEQVGLEAKWAQQVRPTVHFEPGGRVPVAGLKSVLLLTIHADETPLTRYTLDVIDAMSSHFNVLVWHLEDGQMLQEFRNTATGFLLNTEAQSDYRVARQVAFDLLDQHPDIEFALVIGGELKCPLPALAERHVPIIGLVDESVTSASSFYAFEEILFWHTHTFFTSTAAKQLMQRAYPYANATAFSVLVPGPGARSLPKFTDNPVVDARLPSAMRADREPPVDALVLGWGPVTPESGVDLFVACADAICRDAGGKRYNFTWLAQRGPASPTSDPTSYSVSVHAQIDDLGLQDVVSIVYEPLSQEVYGASVTLVLDTSRGERLQHSPVRALERGIPVVAFAGQTDVVGAIRHHGLGATCLARPGSVSDLADRALALLKDESARQHLVKRLLAIDWSGCTMEGYARSIADAVGAVRKEVAQERDDEAFLRETGQLQAEYIGYMVDHVEELECDTARLYVRGWRAGIGARKPRPGFQPHVYAHYAMPAGSKEDPFAHYLRAGEPAGPWIYPVVLPLRGRADAAQLSDRAAGVKAALHIHAFYPDMLDEILARIGCNRILPDLFISVKDVASQAEVAERLRHYAGRVAALEVVPNRGRDIGPFLSTFGARLASEYEFIGHVHTKGSHHAVRHIVDRWRHFLLENLLGGEQSGNMIDSILVQMTDHPEWGIAFPDDPIPLGWDGNREFAEALAPHLKVGPLPEQFCFPVGTMFWMRAAALRPFVGLGLRYEDYPGEPLPVDGTLLHALERLFGVVPRAQGLECALTTVPGVSR